MHTTALGLFHCVEDKAAIRFSGSNPQWVKFSFQAIDK